MLKKLTELTLDPTVRLRHGDHDAAVEHYAEILDVLPAVDVFKLRDGTLLLADGFLRCRAAELAGRKTIEVRLRKGNRADAEEFAILANTKHGEPLTAEERAEGIRRLLVLHAAWGSRKIAGAMGVPEPTVRNVMDADKVRNEVLAGKHLSERHLRAIARAPRRFWEPLAEVAKRGATSDELFAKAKALKSPDLSPAAERRILQTTPRAEDVYDQLKNQHEDDQRELSAWRRVTEALNAVSMITVDHSLEEIVDIFAGEKRDFDQLVRQIGEARRMLDALYQEVAKRQRPRLVK